MTNRSPGSLRSGRSQAFLKNMAPYVSAVYLAQGVVAIRSFINARWLGPEDYGFWGWLTFIVTFGFHLHFGMQEIMLKEIPALQAKGQIKEAKHLAQLTFSFLTAMLVTAAALMTAVAVLLPASVSAVHRAGWVVVGMAMVFEVLFYFEQAVARSLGKMQAMGPAIFTTSLVSLALTVWLVIKYGIVGIYWVAVLTPLFGFIYLHRHTQYSLRFSWAMHEIKRMVRLGWPIVLMGLAFLMINWVDRLIIVRFFGNTAHGYYTLGATLSFFVSLLPKGLADILEPKLHFHHSDETPALSIQRHYIVPLGLFAWLLPPCLLIGTMMLPWVLEVFLPQYLPGLTLIRILLWTSYFVGLIALTKSSLVALGQQSRTVPAYLCAILVNIFVSLGMVKLGLGFSGVALGSAAAFCMISIWLLVLVMRRLGRSVTEILSSCVGTYVPFLSLSVPSMVFLYVFADSGAGLLGWFYGASLVACIFYFRAGYRFFVRNFSGEDPASGAKAVHKSIEVAG